MNEKQIQAQIEMLVEQRNNALNQLVNMAGMLAVVTAENDELKAQLVAIATEAVPTEAIATEAISTVPFET